MRQGAIVSRVSKVGLLSLMAGYCASSNGGPATAADAAAGDGRTGRHIPIVRPDQDPSPLPVANGWALACSVAAPAHPGDAARLPLTLVMTNTSSAPTHQTLSSNDFCIWLVHNGREVPLASDGWLFRRVPTRYPDDPPLSYTASRDLEFQPGQSQSQEVELTRCFSLHEPGPYFVFLDWVGNDERLNAAAATSFYWPG